MRFGRFGILASILVPSLVQAQGPVFEIGKEGSAIRFSVKASVTITEPFGRDHSK